MGELQPENPDSDDKYATQPVPAEHVEISIDPNAPPQFVEQLLKQTSKRKGISDEQFQWIPENAFNIEKIPSEPLDNSLYGDDESLDWPLPSDMLEK